MHYVTDIVRKVRWQTATPSSANVTLHREPLFSNLKNLLFLKKISEIVTCESMKSDKGVVIIIIIIIIIIKFNVIQPVYVPIIVMKIIEDYTRSPCLWRKLIMRITMSVPLTGNEWYLLCLNHQEFYQHAESLSCHPRLHSTSHFVTVIRTHSSSYDFLRI